MSEGRYSLIRSISLTLLGILWLTQALINNDFIAMIIGLSLVLGGASLTLTIRMVSDTKAKRCVEIALLPASLGIIVYGYAASGALILMIIASLICLLYTSDAADE